MGGAVNERALFILLVGLFRDAWPVVYPDPLDGPTPQFLQAWQPQAEGIVSGPAVYFAKIGDHRLGAPKRDSIPDPDNVKGVIRRETQIYETTFQAMGIWEPADTDAEEPTPLTASDLANRAAAILQSDLGLDVLRAADVGILRVTEVRNPKIVNGSDEYEATPSFDFVLTHKQVTLTKAPAVVAYDFRQYPV